ncbi:unnamed protein product [Calypogeia fissa]
MGRLTTTLLYRDWDGDAAGKKSTRPWPARIAPGTPTKELGIPSLVRMARRLETDTAPKPAGTRDRTRSWFRNEGRSLGRRTGRQAGREPLGGGAEEGGKEGGGGR